MIASSRNYAIGMVHFQLGGGWIATGIVLAIYLLCFFGGVAMYAYAVYQNRQFGGGGPPPGLGTGILQLCISLQGIALVLVGGYRVASAIRTDLSSQMIESHRLMPITTTRAVMGYIFGPPTPVIAFVLLNLVLSCAFGAAIGVSLVMLAINQFIIFAFAVYVWGCVALGTFLYRHMFMIVFCLLMLGVCTQGVFILYRVLPGVAVILTPFMGESVVSLTGGPGDSDWPAYAIGMAGQAALFLICFVGSCRLYRGTYPTAFSSRQATLLLAAWAALSAVGIHMAEHFTFERLMRFRFDNGRLDPSEITSQVCGSLVFLTFIAAIPIWSYVREQGVKSPRRAVTVAFLALAGALAAVPAAGATTLPRYSWLLLVQTLLVLTAELVIVYNLFRLMRSARVILAAMVLMALLLAINIAPMILEGVRESIGSEPGTPPYLIVLSPTALIAELWNGTDNVPLWIGIAWQWVMAGGAMLVVYLVERRKRRPPVGGIPVMQAAAKAPAILPRLF